MEYLRRSLPKFNFNDQLSYCIQYSESLRHNLNIVDMKLKDAIRDAQENYEVALAKQSKNSELLFLEINKTPRSDKIGELDENGHELWANMKYALGALNALEELKESIYSDK